MVAKHSATAVAIGRTGQVRDLACRGRRRASGFTMVEMIVVLVIIIAVTALSLPSLTAMVTEVKLRGGMGDLSGLFQACRSLAVKQNQVDFVDFQTIQGHLVAYVDHAVNPNGAPVPTLAQLWMPSQFTKVDEPSGSGEPTALDTTTMWGDTSSGTPATTDTYFNAMGVPCTYNGGLCSAASGYVYYFNYAGTLGGTSWTALGVSPAGRIKAWYWNGSAWTD